MITAAEALSKTHATMLESDLAKIESQILSSIRQSKDSFGVYLYDEDRFFNKEVLLEELRKIGYSIWQYTGSDTNYVHPLAVVWNKSRVPDDWSEI